MFNPRKCPLFQWRLSFGMKLMYSSGVWSYVVGAITTPTFILIPLITIWIGVFPIIITRKFTLAATIYGVSIHLLQYQVKKIWCGPAPASTQMHKVRLLAWGGPPEGRQRQLACIQQLWPLLWCLLLSLALVHAAAGRPEHAGYSCATRHYMLAS